MKVISFELGARWDSEILSVARYEIETYNLIIPSCSHFSRDIFSSSSGCPSSVPGTKISTLIVLGGGRFSSSAHSNKMSERIEQRGKKGQGS